MFHSAGNYNVSGPTLPSEINFINQNELTELDDCFEEFNTRTLEQLVLYVYEDKLLRSPQIEITFNDKCKAIAILDKGSEENFLSERVYTK
jgi:hypothetical protein